MHFYFHQLQVNLSCHKKIIIKKNHIRFEVGQPTDKELLDALPIVQDVRPFCIVCYF